MASLDKLISDNRLGRIIALLDSDKDGEVLAAVSALKRTLKSSGGDLHDLVAMLETKVQPPPNAAPTSWREKLAACQREWDVLSEWERGFIVRLVRWRGALTAKQVSMLDRIYASLR